MAKRKKQPRLQFEELEPLRHNPFGALAGAAPAADRPRSSTDSANVDPEAARAANPTLLVRLEKRARGKTATLVYHIEDDPGGALKRLRKALATGGAVRDGAVELQGDHRAAAAALLREDGYRVRQG